MHRRMNSFNRMQNNVALCELLKGNSGSFKAGLYVYIFGCMNAILTKGIGTGPLNSCDMQPCHSYSLSKSQSVKVIISTSHRLRLVL